MDPHRRGFRASRFETQRARISVPKFLFPDFCSRISVLGFLYSGFLIRVSGFRGNPPSAPGPFDGNGAPSSTFGNEDGSKDAIRLRPPAFGFRISGLGFRV